MPGVALFIFDESVNTLYSRCEGLSIDLKAHVDAGRISVQQVDPAELSPGEFADAIRAAVEQRHVQLVVIDSLNGYLNSMPDETFLVVQLHELLTYLGQSGVATILIAAHHGMIGGQMSTPSTRAISPTRSILLRYFEMRRRGDGRRSPWSRSGAVSTSAVSASSA